MSNALHFILVSGDQALLILPRKVTYCHFSLPVIHDALASNYLTHRRLTLVPCHHSHCALLCGSPSWVTS